MSEKKVLSIDDIERDITGNSGSRGRGFGTLGDFPVVEDLSGVAEYPCDNERCPASQIKFDHVVNRIKGEPQNYRSYDRYEFDWNPELDEFRIVGYYCPICDSLKIAVDDQVVEEQEGQI